MAANQPGHMVATTMCPPNGMPTMTYRTYGIADVLAARPPGWDTAAEMTTAILKGVGAYRFDPSIISPDRQHLLFAPNVCIIYRNSHIEVQSNPDNNAPYPDYWHEVPFAEVPEDIIELLLLAYVQRVPSNEL